MACAGTGETALEVTGSRFSPIWDPVEAELSLTQPLLLLRHIPREEPICRRQSYVIKSRWCERQRSISGGGSHPCRPQERRCWAVHKENPPPLLVYTASCHFLDMAVHTFCLSFYMSKFSSQTSVLQLGMHHAPASFKGGVRFVSITRGCSWHLCWTFLQPLLRSLKSTQKTFPLLRFERKLCFSFSFIMFSIWLFLILFLVGYTAMPNPIIGVWFSIYKLIPDCKKCSLLHDQRGIFLSHDDFNGNTRALERGDGCSCSENEAFPCRFGVNASLILMSYVGEIGETWWTGSSVM